MTARKQLTNKARVLRKHPSAFSYTWLWDGKWRIYDSSFGELGRGPTSALAWAAAARTL